MAARCERTAPALSPASTIHGILTLLGDCVRVLTRLIVRGRDEFGLKIPQFSNHNRRAKRRMLAIMNAKNEKKRKSEYVDLLKITGKVLGYARNAAEMIKNVSFRQTSVD